MKKLFWIAVLALAAITLLEDRPVRAADYQPGSGKLAVVAEDHTWTDQAQKRDIPVRIYAPDPKAAAGPFPLIVLSHGGGESRASFDYLGKYWARNGYLVVCTNHLGSDDVAYREMFKNKRGSETNKHFLRPEDIRFVVDHLFSKELDVALLKGRMDLERFSVSGQCAGSTSALGTVGLTINLPDKPRVSFPDKRVKAVITLGPQLPYQTAGGGKFGVHEQSWATVNEGAPVLVVTGTKDFTWIPAVKEKPDLVRMPYDRLPGTDKYLLELRDAEHHAFTDSADPGYSVILPLGKRDPRHHECIQQATTAFLDAYLKGDKAAREWLQTKRLEETTKGLCKQEHRSANTDRPKR